MTKHLLTARITSMSPFIFNIVISGENTTPQDNIQSNSFDNLKEHLNKFNINIIHLYGKFITYNIILYILQNMNCEYLTHLSVENTHISKLPLLPKTITHLCLNNNRLVKIDDLPPNLIELDCQDNQLQHLSPLKNVEYLNADNNLLKKIPYAPKLKSLSIGDNKISHIYNLPKHLKKLVIGNNNCNDTLKIIKYFPKSLEDLVLNKNNKILFLPKFGNKLKCLIYHCEGKINVIKKIPNSLETLSIGYNIKVLKWNDKISLLDCDLSTLPINCDITKLKLNNIMDIKTNNIVFPFNIAQLDIYNLKFEYFPNLYKYNNLIKLKFNGSIINNIIDIEDKKVLYNDKLIIIHYDYITIHSNEKIVYFIQLLEKYGLVETDNDFVLK
jgi:hypothetical protein